MTHKSFVSLLLLLVFAAAFSQPSFADTYQITFSGTGAPAATEFTYVAGTGFTSDITLVWDGITWTFGASGFGGLNDNFAWNPPGGPCTGTHPGENTFAVLTGQSGVCPFFTGEWAGVTFADNADFTLANFMFGTPLTKECISCAVTAADQDGPFFVTNIPEPGSLSLMFSGLLGLSLFVGIKHLRRDPSVTEA